MKGTGTKALSVILAAAMSVMTMTGCGSSIPESSGAASSAAPAEAATSAADTSASGTAASDGAAAAVSASGAGYDTQAIEKDGDITITLMFSGTPYDNDFETEQLPKLVKEKWPNVTLESTKLPDDNYYTSLKTKLASGECPDIILVQPKYAGQNSCYALADAGYLAPLDDMSCMPNIGKLADNMTYNEHIYGVARGIAILGTFYNKDMFAKYNLSEPTTWDEFLNCCKTLKENGIQPIVMGDKDQYVMQFGLYQLAADEIYSQNPQYDDQLRTGDAKFTDKDTWDKVLTMYKTLYDNGYIDASSTLGLGAAQAIQEFVDGKAAMTFDGSFNLTALTAKGAADFERGYFPLPGDNGVYAEVCAGGGPGIYAKSKYINECKELLDWWFDGSSTAWQADVATGRTVYTYGEGSDTINDLFKPFVQLLNDGKGFYWCNQAWPAGTESEMLAKFSEMVGGQGTTVDDTTKAMQAKYEDLLDE
jgi:raffinose/stachyose/melibiose transport system substrate-binding protein